MISAAHCFTGNNQTAYTQDRVLIGRTARYDTKTDSVLIRVNSVSARAYNGSKSSPSQSARVTSLNEFTEKGQYVCNIGARSGARCSIRVTNHYYRYELEGRPGVSILGYRATQTGSGHAVARGDSGGPVIQNVTGGVRAAGVVSAGVTGTKVTCPANVGSTECFKDIIYVGAFDLQYGGLRVLFS